MLTTAISTAGTALNSISDATTINKLAVIIRKTYGDDATTSYGGGAIEDVPTAIRYSMMKLDRRGDHQLGKTAAGATGAVAGTLVGGPVGTAVGLGFGVLSTYGYRGVKALYKIHKRTRHVHREAAAKVLMNGAFGEGVDTERNDFKAALQALIVIMGIDFVIEVDGKLNQEGGRKKFDGYVKEVRAALSSW